MCIPTYMPSPLSQPFPYLRPDDAAAARYRGICPLVHSRAKSACLTSFFLLYIPFARPDMRAAHEMCVMSEVCAWTA